MKKDLTLGLSIFLLVLGAALGQGPVITEFLAGNPGPLLDLDGEPSDWIEIRNTSGATVSLQGWSLSADEHRVQRWYFPNRSLAPGAFLVVFASEKNRAPVSGELHTDFNLSVEGGYLFLLNPMGQVVSTPGVPYPAQRPGVSSGFGAIGVPLMAEQGVPCRATIPTNGSLGLGWTAAAFNDATWLSGVTGAGFEQTTGYESLIGLDLDVPMYAQNASAYMRVPFTAPAPTTFSHLFLRMKFDDGFRAYLNGVPVASENAPANPTWNSAATQAHGDGFAIHFKDYNISNHLSSMQAGTNVLAIHGLNAAANNTDFLCVPTILAGVPSLQPLWFPVPSPGADNGIGYTEFTEDVVADAPGGLFEGDVLVSLSTSTPGAVIRYTTDGSVPNIFNSTIYNGTISVTKSTILRAIATSPSRAPSRLFTRSYLFLHSVISQATAPVGLPSTWGIHSTNGYSASGVPNPFTAVANYGVNAGLVGASRVRESLLALPIVSLVTAPEDMFPETTGIYSNPTTDWTRPASFEFLTKDGSPSIQVDSGVQIHGGGSRLPWLTPKHSFRLQFQGRYGPDRLRYPLFGEGATDEFDSVVLRASFNDSWVANLGSAQFAFYAKDAYLRRLQREMGHPSARSRFAHLFVNGLYWGLYQPTERPDGRFQAKYLGGKSNEYDVIKHRAPDVVQGDLTAWNTLYNLAGPSAQAFAAVQDYLNLDNFIDYMLLNFYFGTSDWLPNNWYAARKRVPQAGYRFYVWDAELAFKNDDRTGINAPDSPAYIYDRLKGNPEFRLRFADRAYRACFNTGPLTPTRANEILLEELQEAAVGLVGESARWGDWQGTPIYTPESHFTNNMFGSAIYLGPRRDVLIGHLRGAGLYPTIDPPVFNQHGGAIPSGFQLIMTASSPGTILFTLDGSDPRLPGGAISSSAWIYSGPVAFPGFVSRVRARLKNGSEWSALADATYSSDRVLIGEFLARNTTGITDNMGEREDWIEIHNPTNSSVDLSGFYLTDNIQQPTKWAFPQGTTLSANGRLLIWADDQVSQGPLHTNFKLSGAGEQVWLFLPDGITVLDGIVFGPQMDDISLGRLPDGEGAWVSLLDPTPGMPNESSTGVVRFGNINPALHSLRLGMLGTPAVGTSNYLVASTILGGLPHHFIAGTSAVDLPIPGTVTRLLAGPFPSLYLTATASGQGTALAPLVIPSIPALVGLEAVFQVFAVAGPNILSSNGLKVRVGP